MASNSNDCPAAEIGNLSSPPQAGQIIRHQNVEYQTVKEGLAFILTPRLQPPSTTAKKGPKSDEQSQSVFYNPIQQFNRDLSVLAIRAYGEHAIALKNKKAEQRLRKQEETVGANRGKKRKRGDDGGNVQNGDANGSGSSASGNVVTANSPPIDGFNTTLQPTSTSVENASASSDQRRRHLFTILDALSATGLRALRYAKEIPFATLIVSNDLSARAIESIKLNIQHNDVVETVRPNHGDACAYMYSILGPQKPSKDGPFSGKFDVIDLDPYGTAAPFIDAAVQGVCDGGLVCVTCTDAGVFASNGYPEKTYALYGGLPLKGAHSHEGGLRLILHALATSAAKYGLAIEPMLSLSIDFYIRVFVRIHRSPSEVKFTAGKTMIVYNCDNGCGAWKTQLLAQNRPKTGKDGNRFYHHRFAQAPSATPNCEHCGSPTHLSGPMWGGPLHNPHFIQRILDLLPGADNIIYPTASRIEGMLITALEEDLDIDVHSKSLTPEPNLHASGSHTSRFPLFIPRTEPALLDPHPFFFIPSYLCKVVHAQTISEDALRGALRHLGYKSTRSHAKAGSVRTNAPWSVVWEVIREWVRQKSPIKEDAIREGTAGAGIMRRSRENINKNDGERSSILSLRRDILNAIECGKDLSDMTTKIESALYRAGSWRSGGYAGAKAPVEQQGGNIVSPDRPASASETTEATPERPDPSTLNIVFDEALGKSTMTAHRQKRLIRYQMNPRANWGPMTRA